MNVGGTQVTLNGVLGMGISSAGTVVGTVGYNDPSSGTPTGVAAAYSGGQWHSLGAGTGAANWISPDGQTIVGQCGGQNDPAFIVHGGVNGTVTQIPGSSAPAYAANSSGLVVGGFNYALPTSAGGTYPWYYPGAGYAHTVDPSGTGAFSPGAGGSFCASTVAGHLWARSATIPGARCP